MFGRLLAFVLVCINICAIHLVVIVCAGDFRLLFKLLFTFRNIVKHTESRSSLSCNQNIQEDIPTALKVFLCFETKRNDINRSPRKHAREITLGIGPIWRIRSLTLIISCTELVHEQECVMHTVSMSDLIVCLLIDLASEK